jgi:DNA-binding cell septation regulator SpoVG
MTHGMTTQTAQAENRIEVLSIRPVQSTGQLKAIARVRVGCLAIDHIRVLEADNGDLWCGPPQIPTRRKADGSGSGWLNVFEFLDRSVWLAIRGAIVDAYEARLDAAGASDE